MGFGGRCAKLFYRMRSAMNLFPESKFEMRGEFSGFIRDEAGKRRMVVRVGGKAFRFKLPKELRHHFESVLVFGDGVALKGVEERDPILDKVRHIVQHVEILAPVPRSHPPAATPCQIRICAKKNCWKQGGRELWQVLERRIQEAGMEDSIHLKAVGCMDRCKRAPNLECGKTQISHCSAQLAEQIVGKIAAAKANKDTP
jgi:hypothetical protein